MNYQFKNLIFEGGGVKGVAYAGAIKVLEEKGIMSSIMRVGGTSAGAINAELVGLGYTSAQTLNIMNKLNFKKFMDDRLDLPAGKSKVVFNGIEHKKYSNVVPSSNPPVIGYLSRIHKGFGLDKLTDIYIDLKNEPGLENLQLRITGGSSGVDSKFIKKIKRKLKSYIKSGDVQFYKQFDIKHRLDFFTGMTLLSVPMEQPEAFGIYLLEAMSSGVPVVQPDIGAFSEIVDFESGCVYDPKMKKSLYMAIKKIILEPEKTESRAIKARQHIIRNFSLDVVAGKLKEYYQGVLFSSIGIKE